MTAAVGRGGDLSLSAADIAVTLATDHRVDIQVGDVASKPSASLNLPDYIMLAAAIETAGQSGAEGVVVTHGTDTLEETAFALELLLGAPRNPVVLTGAMRRADMAGADGPANLVAATSVALTPDAASLGPVVVMDDQIHAARWVRKAHAFRVGGAFTSAPLGPLGWVVEGRVRLALKPNYAAIKLAPPDAGPVVAILLASADLEPAVVEAASAVSAAVVIAAPGGGHVSAGAVEALAAAARDKPVVFTTRTGAGETLRSTYGYPGSEMDLIARGLIPGGPLTAVKSRVLLQMLLACGAAQSDVRRTFAEF